MNVFSKMFRMFCAVAVLGASGSALAADFTCSPTEITVYPERIHARCSAAARNASGAATIWFFSVSTADAQRANRFLSTVTTALVSGRTLSFNYGANDTSGSTFGCQATDCRVASYFGIN